VSHERIQDPVTREVLATGRSARQGINLEAEVRLTPRLTLFADGTINDAYIKGDPSASGASPLVVPATWPVMNGRVIRPSFHIEPLEPGARVPNVARWLGRVGVEAAISSQLTGRSMLRFSGPYTPIGEPGVETQSYAVLDLGASLDLGQAGTVLDVELQNVFETKYPEIRASGFINPGTPRTLRAAIRLAHDQ
jgi:outer membrane receptor protein involved in Fe transport